MSDAKSACAARRASSGAASSRGRFLGADAANSLGPLHSPTREGLDEGELGEAVEMEPDALALLCPRSSLAPC